MARGAEGIDAFVIPDIGAGSAMLAELKVVDVRRGSVFLRIPTIAAG